MATGKKRVAARVFFLGVTGVALITECWFAWDGNPDTDPWTDLIGDFVPWQLALAVFGALLLWVPAHFIVRYRRRARELKARQAASRAPSRRESGLGWSTVRSDNEENPNQGTLF